MGIGTGLARIAARPCARLLRARTSRIRARTSRIRARTSLLRALGWLLLAATGAHAQTALQLDGSLPNGRRDDLVASQPGPVYTIDQTMGAARGANLFHSFERFSIGTGDTAAFTAADPFEHVLVRVTGGVESTVNGTLRSTIRAADGRGADLFLLNPAGILFGTNAEIDVPGSLFLSTADQLDFEDGLSLDLRDAASPILSVAAPEAFGFLGGAAAAGISFVENGGGANTLSLPTGGRLVAAAGEVRVAGTNGLLALSTPGGTLALTATGSAAARVSVDGTTIDTSEPAALGRVAIDPGASLSGLDFAPGAGDQGALVIRGGRLEIVGADLGYGGNASTGEAAVDVAVEDTLLLGELGFIQASASGADAGGEVAIRADRVEIRGLAAGVFSQSDGAGAGGDVRIDARTIEVAEGGVIASRALGSGAGGAIELVGEQLVVEGGSVVSRGSASGASGAVTLALDTIEVGGAGAEISVEQVESGGASGGLRLGTGQGALRVRDDGLIAVQNRADAPGAALRIESGVVDVRDGGRIESSALAGGAAGDVVLIADALSLGRTPGAATAGGLFSSSAAGATGPGGGLDLTVGSLVLEGGGQLSTSTAGGDAGSIAVDAGGLVRLDGEDPAGNPSGVFSRALLGASGAGGSINLAAASIVLENGAEISARTSAAGAAGDVALTATESITLRGAGTAGSLISAQGLRGAGGDVTLTAPRVVVADGAGIDVTTSDAAPGGRLTIRGGSLEVGGRSEATGLAATLTAETRGAGDADGISLDLSGDLVVDASGRITARSTGGGRAGDVTIAARRVALGADAAIEARSTASADAGSIRIDVAETIGLDRAQITTEALVALGGVIELRAGHAIQLDRSRVSASVGFGVGRGGDVALAAPYVVLNQSAIAASAFRGNGGDIDVTTESLLRSAASTIDASSRFGLDGEIATTSPAEDLTGQLANLGARFSDVADRLRRDCGVRTERVGSFVVTTTPPGERFDADDLVLVPGTAAGSAGGEGSACRPR